MNFIVNFEYSILSEGGKMRKIFGILLLISLICFFMQATFLSDVNAKPYSEHKPAAKTGLVAGSVVTSAAYIPLKLIYAALGGVTSGLTYAISLGTDSETAKNIATKSFTGDWYIHPNILTGEKKLNFGGPEVTGDWDAADDDSL
jgi:hypothetical protein